MFQPVSSRSTLIAATWLHSPSWMLTEVGITVAVGVCTAVMGVTVMGATVMGRMLAVARVSALLLLVGVVCRCLVWAPPGVGMGRMLALLGVSTGPVLWKKKKCLFFLNHQNNLLQLLDLVRFKIADAQNFKHCTGQGQSWPAWLPRVKFVSFQCFHFHFTKTTYNNCTNELECCSGKFDFL